MKAFFLVLGLATSVLGMAQHTRPAAPSRSAMQRPAASVSIGGIINSYTPVFALTTCDNGIVVENASAFNTGDTVLLIQMKGAVIDSTNTAAFGTITDYKNAGNYEINYVKNKTGNTILLKNVLTRTYDLPNGKVQLVRIPYYQHATVTSTLTCLPWDGNKGGVLVLNVADSVILNANIDVTGRGFRGGTGFNSQNATLNCFQNNYTYPQSANASAGQKGESIAIISQNINYGKGSPANGGGAGLGHNSGGGGGSNGGTGGFGGYQLEPCGNSPFDNRGIGGHTLSYSTAVNKIFAGGGGGAGQADNPGNIPPDGGNGGGIIIINANKLLTNTNKIISNGNPGRVCTMPASLDCHDGMAGGGAGGSILLNINQYIDNVTVENKGGKGADMIGSVPLGGRIGAGGGGSGGLLFVKSATLPAQITNTNSGGPNGVLTLDGNNAWGATPGQAGITLFNLSVPVDNTPFKPNIDSVRINKTRVLCDSFQFNGLAFTNTNAIAGWQWIFSDGGSATTQNTGHTFLPGTHNVKLVVTDINGCKDSIETTVIASTLSANAGPDELICSPNSVVLQGSTTGATQYSWSPAAFLNNAALLNPIATPPVTTTFYFTAINASGCSQTDSVIITVRSPNGFTINPPATVCQNQSFQLSASGGDLYAWQPASTLSDPTIFNPVANPTSTTTYSVSITDNICGNTANLSTTITVRSLPLIRAGKSNDINCIVSSSRLTAVGGTSYSWTPAGTLNNANIPTPTASPVVTTTYQVTGTDAAGCSNTDTIQVKVNYNEKGGYLMPTAFTPNNDGLNDCYGVKLWGNITEIEFSIYNRWGQRIYYSKRADACWDGTFKGEMQTPDVYVYMVKAKTTCEPAVFRKGTFALIR